MWNAGVRVPGSAQTATEGIEIAVQGVGPRYFATLGSRTLRGREFDEIDIHGTRKIALVNEVFARKVLLGSANAVGSVLSFEDGKKRRMANRPTLWAWCATYYTKA